MQTHLIIIISILAREQKSIAKDELMLIPPCIAVKS